jgi:hypothetical protein
MPRSAARNGNYIGENTSFTASGSTAQTVKAGVIDVKIDAADGTLYTVKGTLQLADDSFVRIDWSGKIVFVADPPEITYSMEVSAPYAVSPDGGATWTVVEGSQLNKLTVYSDGAPKAYLEIVTAAGITSYSGTYPVSGTIADTSGAVVRGTYVDLPALGWGTEIVKAGSYLMEDTEQFLFEGNLTVTDNDGVLSLTGSFTILDITTPFYAPAALAGVTKPINYTNVQLN